MLRINVLRIKKSAFETVKSKNQTKSKNQIKDGLKVSLLALGLAVMASSGSEAAPATRSSQVIVSGGTDMANAPAVAGQVISPQRSARAARSTGVSGANAYYDPSREGQPIQQASTETSSNYCLFCAPRGSSMSTVDQGVARKSQGDERFERQTVEFSSKYAPGTIIIDTRSRHLYLVQNGGQAIRYGVGVGRPGFEWRGQQRISRKAEWPDWRPPSEMLKRRPDLPRFMAGGPNNPLGARALYLGSTLYRIHGTNEAHTIGQAVSSGCIRMKNEDVTDLYSRVRVGTRVVVM